MSKRSYYGAKKRTGYRGHSGQSRQGQRGPRGGKQYIDPSKFINKAVVTEKAIVEEINASFDDFSFCGQISDNLRMMKFVNPSAIQAACIPEIMNGFDILGMANTGTGKTAAFLLPIINAIYRDRRPLSVLIMAPTRELAQQIDDEFRRFSRNMRLFSAVCVGGTSIDRQIRDLSRRPQVVIGTPGRLSDLIKRGRLSLDGVTTFVLDEVDRMLDMGFVRDIEAIASLITSDHQTLCFSATMNARVKNLLLNYVKSNYKVLSVKSAETNEHIEQDVVRFSDKEHKMQLLKDMLVLPEYKKVLIFSETKYGTQRLSDHLAKNDIPSVAIHGNKSQSQRQKALKRFKDDDVKVMVATDVAARGLDIDSVSHVINFEQPRTYEDYVHRIGRTGRGGKLGKALTFVGRE